MRIFDLRINYTFYTKLSEKEVFDRLFAATGYERTPYQQITDSFHIIPPQPSEKFSGYASQDSFWFQRAVRYDNRALPEISGIYYPDNNGQTILSFSVRLNTMMKIVFVTFTCVLILLVILGTWQSFIDISVLRGVLFAILVVGIPLPIVVLHHYYEASWTYGTLKYMLEAKDKPVI